MNEQISAMVDGELSAADTDRVLTDMKRDEESARTWAAYHLIGDALRGEPALATRVRGNFSADFINEPTLLVPRVRRKPALVRHALPLAASFAAIGFVGVAAWQITHVNVGEPLSAAQIARAPVVKPLAVAAVQEPAAVARRPVGKLPSGSSPYLLAHQEFSSSYAMEGPASYVRTVTAEVADPSR